MWIYEKRLEYPVRITKPDPRMAKLLMAQYGGPDSDVCASKRNPPDRAEMSDKMKKNFAKWSRSLTVALTLNSFLTCKHTKYRS